MDSEQDWGIDSGTLAQENPDFIYVLRGRNRSTSLSMGLLSFTVTGTLQAGSLIIGTLLLMACVAALVLHAAGYWVFARAGRTVAFSAALLSGNRNMGLMLAVTAGTAGETFSLYVGIAQIPMYFAPLLLTPLVRRSL